MDPRAYDLDGFVVVQDLFTMDEAARTAQQAIRAAGPGPSFRHGLVARSPGLWPILVHRGLLQEVAQAVGATCRCLPGIDSVGVGHAEAEPHRDASPEELPCLASPKPTQPYDVVRVITYPSPGPSLFGVLPGSHLIPGSSEDAMAWMADSWRWLELGPRDAVFFDPRLVHAGWRAGRRVMIVLTYGGGGPGTIETYFDARIRTAGLGFSDPNPALVRLLRRRHLFLEASADLACWRHYESMWGRRELGQPASSPSTGGVQHP
ncbi:MAG: hypothetical protein LBJ87_08900 [bacterium]|nr:hypothetical protein [bacterium]